MQGKGAIKFVSVLLILACLYQLSFSLVTRHYESKAAEYAQGDSKKEFAYLDSIGNQKVYLGLFTYKECKEKELLLGLDLKGGMNVTLEVSLKEILRSLSNYSTNESFTKALDLATVKQQTSKSDYITLFGEAWNEVAPNEKLSGIFATYELRSKIKPEMTNNEVLAAIKEEANSAVTNSYNVLSNRINRFGVSSPNVQRIGNTGRILVELPGIKEPERVRKLLQGTANLEFWVTYENSELGNSLTMANERIKELKQFEDLQNGITEGTETPDENVEVEKETIPSIGDSTLIDSLSFDAVAQDSLMNPNNEDYAKEFPLFAILTPSIDQTGFTPGPVIGYSLPKDTAQVNAYFNDPKVRDEFPKDFIPRWSIKPVPLGENQIDHFALIALKATTRDGRPPLDGGAIAEAHRSFGDRGDGISVSMSMNPEGAKTWARLTADNIGKCIAIVLDDYVYSFPRVQVEIKDGQSNISGGFTVQEADDLANVLKSGKLPAPARIVQEAVVGPSLGQQSIDAGMISFILAFVLVLLYMWFYYSHGGIAANVALIFNVFLLFGVMSSFGFVLTLPGIAGIVLTLGMAVDANVIIYERIKEEIRVGKGVRLAIADGYKNAYSAILDGQLTSLITGFVLYFLGTGPIQGFAITLIIGILTSLFTSIFISRLVFEWMLNKNMNIKFGNKLTHDFLAHPKVQILKYRKVGYIISICIVIIGVVALMTKGMTYGIDFTGGRTYVVHFDQTVTTNEVRESLFNKFEEGTEVKQFGSDNQVKITTKYKVDDQSEDVDGEVEKMIYDATNEFFKTPLTFDEFRTTDTNYNGIISSEKVGPTIADDFKINSFFAVLFSLIGIFIYIAIRFRNWQWALGGVLSLAHDAFFMVALFCICAGVLPFSMDVDMQFIAAVLTIIGYSINDTVIIFDRIREYRAQYPKRDNYTNINEAVSSTIMRTINTSMTVLVVLIAIFIFGGEVIRGFSFALIVGIIISVYSTLFVATPIAYELLKKRDKKLHAEKK